MNLPADIVREVERRAGQRCEYCRMHQALQGATFHVEHVVPRSRGGTSSLENLAWACPGCNLHKADRVESADPESGASVTLFNPRADSWSNHFRWDRYYVAPTTDRGRATVAALDLNSARRVQIRKAEALFALFEAE